jgi:hypothetical protein
LPRRRASRGDPPRPSRRRCPRTSGLGGHSF